MQTKILSLVTLSLAISLASSECLSSDTLKAIGFDTTQDLAVVASPTVCTDLFKDVGTCVPEAEVEAKIKADNENFKARVNIFADVSEALTKLADTIGSESEADKTAIENILSRTESTKNSCVNAWSVVQQGITCYLASGSASTNTSVGTTVSVNVDRAVVGPYLESCLDYIDSICLLTAGMSISTSVTVSDTTFLTKTDTYLSGCQTLKTNYSCTTDECKNARYDAIINIFFKPYDYEFFPNSSIFANITDKLKDLADNVTDWFKDLFERRLLDESDVETRSASEGTDAKTYGEKSGQEKVTENASIISMLVAATFALVVA